VNITRFPESRILRVDELEFIGHRWSRAKYAAAFFRKSFSIFSSRFSRSTSHRRAVGHAKRRFLAGLLTTVNGHPVAEGAPR
jgi:hypothetical protein